MSYDMTLVVLSYIVSVLGSYTALRLAVAIPTAEGPALWGWLFGAAAALGGGAIWAMHFLAMLACDMSMPVTYDVPLTVLSLLIAILVTAAGLYTVGRGEANWSKLIGAGVFTGLGVAGMHYTGMAAMRFSGEASYDTALVLASIVIAIAAATAALWLAFNLRGHLQVFGSAFVMAIAVCGMHYTGMAAISMNHEHYAAAAAGWTIRPEGLGFYVFCITILLLGAALAISARRAREAALSI